MTVDPFLNAERQLRNGWWIVYSNEKPGNASWAALDGKLDPGGILGFGVSGTKQLGLLKPVFGEAPAWLTGGTFGLEASAPGLICVVAALLLLNMWRPHIAKEPTCQAGFFVRN